jgi:hypothetical protein
MPLPSRLIHGGLPLNQPSDATRETVSETADEYADIPLLFRRGKWKTTKI